MPKKPMCGGKPVNGRNTRSKIPVTAKNAIDASWMRVKPFSLVAMDTDCSPLPLAVGVKLINLPYFVQNRRFYLFLVDAFVYRPLVAFCDLSPSINRFIERCLLLSQYPHFNSSNYLLWRCFSLRRFTAKKKDEKLSFNIVPSNSP
jgi:hypothetical protein